MLKVEDIVNQIDLPINGTFIRLFCSNINVQREYEDAAKKHDGNRMRQILIENEADIDKAKMILALLYFLNTALEENKRIQNQLSLYGEISAEGLFLDTVDLESQIDAAKKLGKDVNIVLSETLGRPKENRYELLVIDSNEMIHNERRKNNIGKLNQINEQIKGHKTDGEKELSGIQVVLFYLNATDIQDIFINERLGEVVIRVLYDNQLLKTHKLDVFELERIKAKEPKKYSEWNNGIHFSDAVDELEKIIEENNQYVDFNKLLLISAYRYQELLEANYVVSEDIDEYASILRAILSMTKSRDITVHGTLEDSNEEASYDIEKLRDCLRRFTSKGFLTKEYVNEIKEEVKTGKRALSSLDDERIHAIFLNDELEQLAQLNDKNFIYVSRILKWKKEKIISKLSFMGNISGLLLETFLSDGILDGKDIIDLYIKGIISIEQINIISKIFDLSNEISEQKLYELYINLERGNAEDREKSKKEYEQYLALYRIIFKDADNEKKNIYSENLVEKILEKNDENVANKYLREFFVNEVITPEAMINWCGKEKFEELVLDWYQDNFISVKRISYLVETGKLSREKINDKIIQPKTSHEQRMEIIKKGLADIKTIEILFRRNLLFYDDVNQLIETGIVDGLQMAEIINGVSLGKRTENSEITLGDTFEEIPLTESFFVKTKRYLNDNGNLIIDPNAKETLFSLLGAVRPTNISISEDSAFYNYNFYIIPNENGEITAESIVIVEPTDKVCSKNIVPTQDEIVPTINERAEAETYCCKYGDLMVLDNYIPENGEIKEIKNTGYKVKNNLATEKKRGSWGISLLYAVIKTMASSDMEYPEGQEEERSSEAIEILNRRYNPKQILKMLNFIGKIDTGRCNCEAPKKCVDEVSTDDEEQDL